MKKLEDIPNRIDVKKDRREYDRWLTTEALKENLIYVDECGFNLFTRRTRGRARIGQRAVRQVLNTRGKNLTLILAIFPSVGILYFELSHDTVNAEKFDGFLEILSAVVGEEFDCVTIIDNAPIHRNCTMTFDNHRVKKLPAYSPMLNAVKQAFSTLKMRVKQRLNERMENVLDRAAAANQNVPLTVFRSRILHQLVTEALEGETVTQRMCQNWHNHVMSYVPRCLDREDILT